MIVYDVVTKVLDTESFPQHNNTGLISGIRFVLFSQEKRLRWKEMITHTHARTHARTHAHAHARTHTHTNSENFDA